MNYILFDDARRNNLLPFTFLRPVADIRFGILTIREKWEKHLNTKTSTLTEKYLRAKYPVVKAQHNFLINGSICPNTRLIEEIHKLEPNQTLMKDDCLIAMHLTEHELERTSAKETQSVEEIYTDAPFCEIVNTYDIFLKNGRAIEEDFAILTSGRKSVRIPAGVHSITPQNIFIEEGAKVHSSYLNASAGPIYIGKDAEIMEGAMIRGPLALCEGAIVKMGSKIYGPTTIGPQSKIGGEVNQSVIFGYSSKAHDGFLGHSVLAEWCNIGADTNTSNLKNNYEPVRLWNYPEQSFVDTGLTFCGLLMGDHSKCGINTMFNTGTVVGVSANIYGTNFQRNFISSFARGGTGGFTTYDVNKAIKVAEFVYKRRNFEFTDIDRDIFYHVFNITFEYRKL
ncbi:MAG: GlmU family protein [Bacteroidales bacterium]|nr:GlmU family protein [Bacteroidales bacterium]